MFRVQNKILFFCVLAVFLALSGCNIPFRSIKPVNLPPDSGNGPFYQPENYQIITHERGASTDSIIVQYLGCGGFYIRKNEHAFLADPFFSYGKIMGNSTLRLRRLRWLSVLAKRNVKIKPHTGSINKGYDRITSQPGFVQPKAILITHGHYDHLLDVPYIYKTKFPVASAPTIYGNLTSSNLLKDIIPAGHLHDMEPGMQNQHNAGTWQTIGEPGDGDYIRFMAIEADHAPHAKALKLFDGDGLHSIGDYETYLSGTPINHWLEGRTLGLLVDFMNATDSISFRMFIQTSACSPTRGLLPERLKKEKAVDLAVICVASFELVDEYPNLLLKNLEPQHVMLVHWEDFLFKSYDSILKKPKTIGFSSVKAFIAKMQETRERYGLKYKYTMPAPGVTGIYRVKE